jgi:hypothetical protein
VISIRYVAPGVVGRTPRAWFSEQQTLSMIFDRCHGALQESASLTASAARNLRRQVIDGAVRPYRYRSSLRSWNNRGKRPNA